MLPTIELTPELEARIVASIRAGGFPHVAAQAWGVPPRLLERWLARGRRRKAPEIYRRFARNVDQAAAQARLKAEIDAYKCDPRGWLKHGPGKEQTDRPGWSAPVRAAGGGDSSLETILADQNVSAFLAATYQLLCKHPAARADFEQLAGRFRFFPRRTGRSRVDF